MTLILLYLVVLVLVATVLFGLGSVIFGRGETLPPLPRGTTATVLPASGVTGADVDAIKFAQVVRGYKTGEVDWVLDRLGRELDSVRGELAAVRAAYGVPDDFDDAGLIVGTDDDEDAADEVSATAGEVRTSEEP
ncbi:DivIVA domain-containing protein [Mycolicibacterium lutetiense]